MHRFQSQSTINRFRIVSLLFCLKMILLPVTAAILVYGVLFAHRHLAITSLLLGGTVIFLVIVQWIAASRTRCPLCMTPVLAKKRCSKHRNARRLLGSYRLRVALSVLTKGNFKCPYCHEPSALQMRNRPEKGLVNSQD